MALNKKFPIVLAPTGMVPTKQLNPNVPLSPQEIINDVKKCYELGITSVHLHARDEEGNPTWEKEIYSKIIYGIREFAPDLAINVSTSGRNWSDFEKRADCLNLVGDLKPDLASLTTSSLNFISGASINDPETVRKLATVMLERGIKPELEIFDLGMINAISVLKKEGLLKGTLVANLFFGNIYGAQATGIEMSAMVAALPKGTIWSGAGLGVHQINAHAFSLAVGGGIRTGLEDSIYLDREKTVLATNYDLVRRVHSLASELDLEVMSPTEFKLKINED